MELQSDLVDAPSQIEVPWGANFDIILTLWTLQVRLKFHGGANFDIILTLWRLQVSLKFHGGGNF